MFSFCTVILKTIQRLLTLGLNVEWHVFVTRTVETHLPLQNTAIQ